MGSICVYNMRICVCALHGTSRGLLWSIDYSPMGKSIKTNNVVALGDKYLVSSTESGVNDQTTPLMKWTHNQEGLALTTTTVHQSIISI